MRLDYYLTHTANLSRKEAKIAIGKKRVSVNGEVVLKANAKVSEQDKILLDNTQLAFIQQQYYMLHKPVGVVCATEDADRPTVLDLLPAQISKHLKIVGRLDKDTSGLLFLTSDGQWLHTITSPKKKIPKTYLVELAEDIAPQAITELEQGVLLRGEDKPTSPAVVQCHNSKQISLTITEGKYHQVKRMLGAVGNRVIGLHRSKIADIELPKTLMEGEYKALTPEQIDSFS